MFESILVVVPVSPRKIDVLHKVIAWTHPRPESVMYTRGIDPRYEAGNVIETHEHKDDTKTGSATAVVTVAWR